MMLRNSNLRVSWRKHSVYTVSYSLNFDQVSAWGGSQRTYTQSLTINLHRQYRTFRPIVLTSLQIVKDKAGSNLLKIWSCTILLWTTACSCQMFFALICLWVRSVVIKIKWYLLFTVVYNVIIKFCVKVTFVSQLKLKESNLYTLI